MYTKGEFTTGNVTYGAIVNHTRNYTEAILILSGVIVSAYKVDNTGSYSFNNSKAKEMVKMLQTGIKGCTSKNCTPSAFDLGTMNKHKFEKSKIEYNICLYRGELVDAFINTADKKVDLNFMSNRFNMPTSDLEYIKLTEVKKDFEAVEDSDLSNIVVRSVQEIALEKEDVSWLKNKKYFIVNDDEQAEALFSFLDNYTGVIAYDTETTGLKINCFGKINSEYQKTLIKYNIEHPDEQIRADRLVGIIFCVEENVSYYFPCFNRKFKNLYQDKNSRVRQKTIDNIKSRYTIGDLRNVKSDMADYVRNTKPEDFSEDVILMERCRDILHKHHIVAHNGIFEWKVGWQYEIDTNLTDDTIIMHQLMYKFRSTTSNRGEPSNLKYLAKRELGIEQWELGDFFPDYKDDKTGEVREKTGSKKKKSTRIDFSYMDYEGTKVYAPTDGDVTLQLFNMYKKDMKENYRELEYIYSVEIIVSCAIAYMEFYGHRIAEEKILNAREQTRANIASLESQIRQLINYSSQEEIEAYNELHDIQQKLDSLDDSDKVEEKNKLSEQLPLATQKLQDAIANNTEHILNLASPAQVADLFYTKLGIPFEGDKMSVAKKKIEQLVKAKDDEGKDKYPVVHLYSKYKNEDTLLTKFFDNLPYFMYPGGFIFSSYGQISTATGRMSCSKPNAQQYPKVITKIVSPRPGYVMVDADYSQIEYRVLTALAKNEGLAELFKDPDSDYHTLMASLMYEVAYASVTSSMRSAAKSFNFGIPYGMGFGSLALLLTGKNTEQTRDEAREKYEMYFKNQPKTRKFFDNVKEMAQINRYTKTLFNRYRYYSFEDKDGNFSSKHKAAALRQAGNAVIQGTAADIFKIGVARNFSYIRENNLLGLLLIINMVHDEQLMEINAKELNVQRVLSDIGKNMQFEIPDFPPLYIGAGVGPAWGYAKSKIAEIHPLLLDKFIEESKSIPIRKETTENEEVDTEKVLKYFDDRIYNFRLNKVKDYILDSKNWNKDMHPAIGGLINLQFNYGRGDEAKKYKGPNGETYTDQEFLMLNITEFIEKNGLNVKPEWFSTQETFVSEDEDEKGYDDSEDLDELEDLDGSLFDEDDYNFTQIDESDKLFGASIHDLIAIFGVCILPEQRICGIDMRDVYFKTKDNVIDYLYSHICEESTPNSYEIVFLIEGNILNHTECYVSDITEKELEKHFKDTTKSPKEA